MTHGPNEAHSFVRHQSIRWCEGAIPMKCHIAMRIRDLAGINACATHLRPRSWEADILDRVFELSHWRYW